MKLIITEKPSVAIEIGKVLKVDTRKDGYLQNNEYIITWCFGHLIQLAYPTSYDKKYEKWKSEDLPIIPSNFKTEINKNTSKQYYLIKNLMNREDISEIICATDSAREGELIFRYVYNKANCKKPFKRLWISSQTEKAIKEGFANLKSGTIYNNLYESALCRAKADWLIGLNLTRLYSIKNNKKLTIGRCQTATLDLIVKRYLDIKNFKSATYYNIEAECEGEIKAICCSKDGNKNNFINKYIAQLTMKNIESKGYISKLQTKRKLNNRPLLFSLNELQKEANQKFGYTAKETLEIAQSLYETHKITTYPRTSSKYLDSNTEYKIKEYLNYIAENEQLTYKEYINEMINDLCIDENIINDKEIEDHHAIIVTENIKNFNIDILNEKEKNILNMIIIRFILALSKKQELEETEIEIELKDSSYVLKSKNVKILFDGWKELERKLCKKSKQDNPKEVYVLNKKIGDEVNILNLNLKEIISKPKHLYTDGSLISDMENIKKNYEDKEIKQGLKHGIGTTATRAEIIEKLINIGYVERNKKQLQPTELGLNLINVLPFQIKSPEFTAEWENKLKEIEKGNLKSTIFIQQTVEFLNNIFNYEKNNINKIEVEKKEREVIGQCPYCNKNIYESNKNFYCDGFKDNPKCNFVLWKEDKFFSNRGKKLTKSIAKDLINNKETKVKFTKKDKSGTYEALVKIIQKNNYINFELEFI